MVTYYPKLIEKTILLRNVTSSDISTIVSNNVSTPISKMKDEGVVKAIISVRTVTPPEETYQMWFETEYEWEVFPSAMSDTDISNLASEVEAVLSGMKERYIQECVLSVRVV